MSRGLCAASVCFALSRAAAFAGAMLLAQPVASQAVRPASEPPSVLEAVMRQRLYWMEDRTPFDPCSLHAHAGGAAALPAELPVELRGLVLAAPAAGGCAAGEAVARALPPRVVRVESVAVADSVATVRLLVQKDDHVHREDHTLARRRGALGGWGVVEVRTWGRLYVHLPRP